jgi:hypothetical protein
MAPASILVTRKGAPVLLGISISMIDKLVRKGILEPIRLGKKVMFRRDAIEELTLPPSRRRALHNIDPTVPVQ